ncbi:MAG: hypothetical protein JSU09_12715 [Bacteroidetes bacterium]|nr:hypothetical protein [Bacteroidota bacterium]
MKSNKAFWVAIAALSFVTMVSFVYAFIQAGIATVKERESLNWANEAMANAEIAKKQQLIADDLKIKLSECQAKMK